MRLTSGLRVLCLQIRYFLNQLVSAEFSLRDLNGKLTEEGEVCEQFTEMFRYFVEMMDDEEKIALEREAILRRAKLLNDIVNFDSN